MIKLKTLDHTVIKMTAWEGNMLEKQFSFIDTSHGRLVLMKIIKIIIIIIIANKQTSLAGSATLDDRS